MNEISVNATFELSNQSQRDLDSVRSTFSVLQTAFEDINKDGIGYKLAV